MAKSTKERWIKAFETLVSKPALLGPFIIIGFISALALEMIYFFPRKPLMYIFNPIVSKFYGEVFVHYPGSMLILPNLFHVMRLVIYALIGAFLTAVTVSMLKGYRTKASVNLNTTLKNAAKRYSSFFLYGVMISVLVSVIRKVDMFLLQRMLAPVAEFAPNTTLRLFPVISQLFIFFTNFIAQIFLVCVIPIIVFKNKSFLKALGESVAFGLKNFFPFLLLLVLPFSLYLPLVLVNLQPLKLVEATFPEIYLYVSAISIILSIFVDCYIIVCVSQFYLEKNMGKR